MWNIRKNSEFNIQSAPKNCSKDNKYFELTSQVLMASCADNTVEHAVFCKITEPVGTRSFSLENKEREREREREGEREGEGEREKERERDECVYVRFFVEYT